jgi:hypothetical protein
MISQVESVVGRSVHWNRLKRREWRDFLEEKRNPFQLIDDHYETEKTRIQTRVIEGYNLVLMERK